MIDTIVYLLKQFHNIYIKNKLYQLVFILIIVIINLIYSSENNKSIENIVNTVTNLTDISLYTKSTKFFNHKYKKKEHKYIFNIIKNYKYIYITVSDNDIVSLFFCKDNKHFVFFPSMILKGTIENYKHYMSKKVYDKPIDLYIYNDNNKLECVKQNCSILESFKYVKNKEYPNNFYNVNVLSFCMGAHFGNLFVKDICNNIVDSKIKHYLYESYLFEYFLVKDKKVKNIFIYNNSSLFLINRFLGNNNNYKIFYVNNHLENFYKYCLISHNPLQIYFKYTHSINVFKYFKSNDTYIRKLLQKPNK